MLSCDGFKRYQTISIHISRYIHIYPSVYTSSPRCSQMRGRRRHPQKSQPLPIPREKDAKSSTATAPPPPKHPLPCPAASSASCTRAPFLLSSLNQHPLIQGPSSQTLERAAKRAPHSPVQTKLKEERAWLGRGWPGLSRGQALKERDGVYWAELVSASLRIAAASGPI